MQKPTPQIINKFLDNYGKSAYHLKQLKLADLPDSKDVSMSIRASDKLIKEKDLWLEILEKLELMDRLKIAVDKYKLRYVNKGI